MYQDNSFIVLGRTGVGKSTLTKILSGDETIEIDDSADSVTLLTKSYNCEINGFRYSIIDTPGYDDSEGRDKENYKAIKKYLTSTNIKLKGVILMFSFQDPRFSDSHRKGLQKIVKLIPMDNFWDYVTIIFTRYYSSDNEELLKERKKRLKDFEKKFDVLISAFNKAKGIKVVPFSHINTIFVDLKISKTKKEDLKEITSLLKNLSKLEPLYHQVKIEINWNQLIVKNDGNSNKNVLYDVKFKNYSYYNQKGEVIKTLAVPLEKKKIKELEYKDFHKIEDSLTTIGGISGFLGGWSGVLALATIVFPPAFSFFATSFFVNGAITFGTMGGSKITKKIEDYCNKELREEKIVEELLIDEDDEE